MKHVFKKITLLVGLIGLVGIMGCSSKVKTDDTDYLRCNATSAGRMAETEDGFFLVKERILYYADKSDLETWVPVCNQPNCTHQYLGENFEENTCNAFLLTESRFVQKDDNFYVLRLGNIYEGIHIFEIETDGSGRKTVYELPEDDDIMISTYGQAIFPEQMVVYYGYLDEWGIYQKCIIALKEDENGELITQNLYEGTTTEKNDSGMAFINGNYLWSIRGDDIVMTSLRQEDEINDPNIIWRVGEKELEKINLPDDVELLGGYLSGETFTYYEINEGFYEVDIHSGKKKLISENQMENGLGYIFTEKYMVECNRHKGYRPEEAHLKFYNGEKWITIELPEEVKNSDKAFYPFALSSDRIFYQHEIEKKVLKDNGEIEVVNVIDWYYFMIDEENPELICIGEIPKVTREYVDSEEETESSSSTEEENDNFKDIVVFDTERCLLKITNMYTDYNNRYCIDMYCESRDNIAYDILGNNCAINGIQCNTNWGGIVEAGKSNRKLQLRFENSMIEQYKVSDFYDVDEYTDIEIGFKIRELDTLEVVEEKMIHIYPQGKENVKTFTKEFQNTDQLLIDNESVTAAITGYENTFVKNDTINVILFNKTEQCVTFYVEKASANGILMKNSDGTNELYKVVVNPRTYAICPITLFDQAISETFDDPNNEFFVKNNITSIEKIDMELRVYPSDYMGIAIGEDFVKETFILNTLDE